MRLYCCDGPFYFPSCARVHHVEHGACVAHCLLHTQLIILTINFQTSLMSDRVSNPTFIDFAKQLKLDL
jgi:hypothetical protein